MAKSYQQAQALAMQGLRGRMDTDRDPESHPMLAHAWHPTPAGTLLIPGWVEPTHPGMSWKETWLWGRSRCLWNAPQKE